MDTHRVSCDDGAPRWCFNFLPKKDSSISTTKLSPPNLPILFSKYKPQQIWKSLKYLRMVLLLQLMIFLAFRGVIPCAKTYKRSTQSANVFFVLCNIELNVMLRCDLHPLH